MPAIQAQSVEEVKPIQGKMPASVEEWRVSVSLGKAGLDYIFQWIPPIFVAGERGSTIVDFLVMTAPLPTPLFVDGEYWHSGVQAAQDEMVRARLFQAMAGRIARPRSLPAGKIKDQDLSDSQIRMMFG